MLSITLRWATHSLKSLGLRSCECRAEACLARCVISFPLRWLKRQVGGTMTHLWIKKMLDIFEKNYPKTNGKKKKPVGNSMLQIKEVAK
jgi:hypothetical protein